MSASRESRRVSRRGSPCSFNDLPGSRPMAPKSTTSCRPSASLIGAGSARFSFLLVLVLRPRSVGFREHARSLTDDTARTGKPWTPRGSRACFIIPPQRRSAKPAVGKGAAIMIVVMKPGAPKSQIADVSASSNSGAAEPSDRRFRTDRRGGAGREARRAKQALETMEGWIKWSPSWPRTKWPAWR